VHAPEAAAQRLGTGRLVAWCCLVGAVSALNFAARAAGEKPGSHIFYQWSNAIGATIQYALLLGLTLLIAIGLPWRQVFALRRPSSWKTAAKISALILALMWVAGAIVSQFGNPGKEQGLTPHHWDSHRAAAFAANLVAVSIIAPIVEELIFRGLGFSLLERFGERAAIALVGVAFGLWHGLVVALPLLILFGGGLAYLRARTRSVYPGMVLHGLFNTASVVLSLVV
jgi:membrane protease YdiL (CAAX protease family)